MRSTRRTESTPSLRSPQAGVARKKERLLSSPLPNRSASRTASQSGRPSAGSGPSSRPSSTGATSRMRSVGARMSQLMLPTASSRAKVRAPSPACSEQEQSPKEVEAEPAAEEPEEQVASRASEPAARQARRRATEPARPQSREAQASVGARMRLVQHHARTIHIARPDYQERVGDLAPMSPGKVVREAFQDVTSATRAVMIAAKLTPESVAEAMAQRKGYGRLKASSQIEGRLPLIRAKTAAVDAFARVFADAHVANVGVDTEDVWAKLVGDLSTGSASMGELSTGSPVGSARRS